MCPHHSDQMSQRSQVSRIALFRCSQNVFVFVIVFVFVFVIVFVLVRSCLLITLIKCLKGHKSLGSLCSVVKTLIVSGNRATKGQGHLLSCCGQLKNQDWHQTYSDTFERYLVFMVTFVRQRLIFALRNRASQVHISHSGCTPPICLFIRMLCVFQKKHLFKQIKSGTLKALALGLVWKDPNGTPKLCQNKKSL